MLSAVYRMWARMRLGHLEGWIGEWDLPEIFAGVPGKGADRAWYKVVYLGMEAMKCVTKFTKQEWQIRSYSRLTGATISLAMQEAAPALTAPSSTSTSSIATAYSRPSTSRNSSQIRWMIQPGFQSRFASPCQSRDAI